MAADRASLDQLFATTGSAADLRERAERLLRDDRMVAGLLDRAIAPLAADPMADLPFKASRDRIRQSAVLYNASHVRVTASVVAARELSPAASVVLPGLIAVTRYHRAGGARVRRWRRDADAARVIEIAPLVPADGTVVVQDGCREAHVIAGAVRDVVTVTVVLRDAAPPLMREYDAAEGRLVRSAAHDDAQSRRLLLLTLLRTMRHGDTDVFAAATRADAYFARWSAMREWLALDARAALPRLAEMAASDPEDDVRRAAAATLVRARDRLAPCRV